MLNEKKPLRCESNSGCESSRYFFALPCFLPGRKNNRLYFSSFVLYSVTYPAYHKATVREMIRYIFDFLESQGIKM